MHGETAKKKKKKKNCTYLNIHFAPHTKHKNQLVKAVQGKSRCLFGGPKLHRNTPHEQNVERLNFQSGNTLALVTQPLVFRGL
jgi:hypothetical protein